MNNNSYLIDTNDNNNHSVLKSFAGLSQQEWTIKACCGGHGCIGLTGRLDL